MQKNKHICLDVFEKIIKISLLLVGPGGLIHTRWNGEKRASDSGLKHANLLIKRFYAFVPRSREIVGTA
jgi:hypothetical protein